jgi:Sec-independent protein translocase protein TatA
LRAAASGTRVEKGRAVFDIKIMVILVAALILIGPDKLPDIARTLGKFIRMFNNAKAEMERSIKADMFATEETTKAFTDTGASVASTLYGTNADDDEEDEEE